MTFSFHPEAEAELFAAIEYYEEQEPGLGQAFSFEVTSAILNVVDYPKAWPTLEDDVRRCLTHRFPFGVLYTLEREHILILAVMHLRRGPDYWKSRR